MRTIVSGVAAFFIAGLFDLAALKGIRYLKQILGLAAVLLFTSALTMAVRHPLKLEMPFWLSYVGWPLLAVSLSLLIYSLFLEIPFRRTYVNDGVGAELVTSGTYALTRHPGVLWFALLLGALLLLSRSKLLLLAAPVWILADALLVWVQDVWFFPQMFPGYERYRQDTPMLIPTSRSIVRFWRSIRVRREGEARPEGGADSLEKSARAHAVRSQKGP